MVKICSLLYTILFGTNLDVQHEPHGEVLKALKLHIQGTTTVEIIGG